MLTKASNKLKSISTDTKCYLIIVLSCVFFSLCSLFTDLIDRVAVNEILWWRFLFSTGIVLAYTLSKGHGAACLTAWRDQQVLLSALFGTITASSTVFALRNLPIGEATLLLTTAPIFTIILSSIFLKERLQWTDYISLVVATLGVVCVAQPDFLFVHHKERSTIFYAAIGVALSRGFFKAAKFVAVSTTQKSIPTHVIVLYLSLMGLTAVTFINVYLFASHYDEEDTAFQIPSLKNILIMIMMSSTYFLQQLCVCSAMRYGKPAKASLLKYLDVVLPFLFQITIFKLYPNTWSTTGCVLIVLAMLTVISVKRSDTYEPGDKPGKYMKIMNDDGDNN